jgi:hypothetical protein
VEIKPDTASNIQTYLTSIIDSTETVLDYVVDYVAKHPTIDSPDKFELSDADFEDFKQHVIKSGFKYDGVSEKILQELVKSAKFEGYYNDAKNEFAAIEKKLKEEKDFIFIVDETNANGIFGEHFGGIADEQNAIYNVDIVFSYLYKSFGCMGEYVAMTTPMKEMIMQNSLRRDLINKSTINPIMAVGTLKALELAEEERWRRHKVMDLGKILHNSLSSLGFTLTESETGIVTIIFETDREVIDISKMLFENKILAAVTIGKTTIKPRLRFFIGAHFDNEDIEKIVEKFKLIKKEYYVDKTPASIE